MFFILQVPKKRHPSDEDDGPSPRRKRISTDIVESDSTTALSWQCHSSVVTKPSLVTQCLGKGCDCLLRTVDGGWWEKSDTMLKCAPKYIMGRLCQLYCHVRGRVKEHNCSLCCLTRGWGMEQLFVAFWSICEGLF